MPPPVQIEAVLRKVQDRLSEAMTTIAVLQVQIELLEAEIASTTEAEDAPPPVKEKLNSVK